MRPSLDAEEEPGSADGAKAPGKVEVHKPLRDETLSAAAIAPSGTAARSPSAPAAVAEANGTGEQAGAAASDRYVLLANLWESGTPPPSLASSNGMLALAVPANSALADVFKKGDGYRFQQGGYTATFECLDVFATPQEAFASYPEGMRVSNQPPTYLHWREPSEQGALSAASWVRAELTVMAVAAKSLEAFLIDQGGVSAETVEKARERQRDGKGLGDVLQEMGAIDPRTWAQALADHFGLPFSERLPEDSEILELIAPLPINFAKRCLLLPVSKDGETVVVATADPANIGALDDLRLLLRKPIRVFVAPGPVVIDAINRVYDMASGSASELMDDLDQERLDLVATDLEEPRDLLESDDEAPIIRLVNSLLFQAAKDRASDIHIEPFERSLAVRFRIDGILYDIISAAQALSADRHLARQDHGGPQHRREAAAAGRTDPHSPRRQGH